MNVPARLTWSYIALSVQAARMRDQTDLASVRSSLMSAVDRAMRPQSATMWVRET
jgi:hypothetical protein